MDLVYNPPQSQLLKDAAAAHCTTMNGELMLLQQGSRSFELWTGQHAPLDVMQAELERAREQGLHQLPVDMGPGGEGTPSAPGQDASIQVLVPLKTEHQPTPKDGGKGLDGGGSARPGQAARPSA